MDEWFETKFLPSLFEQSGTERCKWLTAKQTGVCASYMEEHTPVVLDRYGEGHVNAWYDCEWRGRKVILSYNPFNGCGRISFGDTEAEREEHRKEEAIKREQERKESLEYTAKILADRSHPMYKRTVTVIKRLRGRIEAAEREISDVNEDIAAATEAGDGAWEQHYRKELHYLEDELADLCERLSWYVA